MGRKITNRSGGVTNVLKTRRARCCPRKIRYARGLCRSCYEKDLRKRNPGFAERQRENCRQWARKFSERKRKSDAAWKAKQDPLWRWAVYLRHRFGITPRDYQRMFVRQGGRCAICQQWPGNRRLAVDHCHETGKIRGLLCFRCNFGLSFFSEDCQTFYRAAKYLR